MSSNNSSILSVWVIIPSRWGARQEVKYIEGGSYWENIEEKSRLRAVTSDNSGRYACVYYSASGRVATLSCIIFFYVYVCVSDMFQGKEKYSWTRKREWMSCCCCWPLYTWKWTTCAFSNLFYFCPRPILVQHEERSKKKKNSPDFFLFSYRATHTLENGIPLKGVLAGWIVSFHRHLLF